MCWAAKHSSAFPPPPPFFSLFFFPPSGRIGEGVFCFLQGGLKGGGKFLLKSGGSPFRTTSAIFFFLSFFPPPSFLKRGGPNRPIFLPRSGGAHFPGGPPPPPRSPFPPPPSPHYFRVFIPPSAKGRGKKKTGGGGKKGEIGFRRPFPIFDLSSFPPFSFRAAGSSNRPRTGWKQPRLRPGKRFQCPWFLFAAFFPFFFPPPSFSLGPIRENSHRVPTRIDFWGWRKRSGRVRKGKGGGARALFSLFSSPSNLFWSLFSPQQGIFFSGWKIGLKKKIFPFFPFFLPFFSGGKIPQGETNKWRTGLTSVPIPKFSLFPLFFFPLLGALFCEKKLSGKSEGGNN